MTLADIKTAVRELLQDSQYDGAVITRAANSFVYELFNNNRTRLMEDSTTLTVSAGEVTVDFPDNMLAWIAIYATSPSVYDMSDNFTEYGQFMTAHAGFATSTAARADTWTAYGNAMRFAAPLNAEHTFQVDFVREPVAMEADSDDCEVPDRYAELVARGTKARVMEIEEDYQYAQQERDLLQPLVTTFIRNEARGGGKTKPTVIRSRRNRNSRGGVPRLGE
jgi:hypothetical protein